MSYCNISDAFSINNKFEDTVKGLRTINPASFELSNVSNGYGSLSNNDNDYDSPYGQSYNDCGQSLNGTNLTNLITDNSNKKSEPSKIKQLNLSNSSNTSNTSNTIPNLNKKLTHRDCINIYTNPTFT